MNKIYIFNFNNLIMNDMDNILIDQCIFGDINTDNLSLKRLFDITISTIALLVLSPVFLIVALLILIDSKGPLFFAQTRIGKQGKAFKMWKFRSMYVDAEARKSALIKQNNLEEVVRFKLKTDPRITRVGHLIRHFSLDELPQFWNVLQGEMSLVGPRPPLPNEVEQYTPYQARRLAVVPGITCIWQVSGRSDIPFEKQVEMDLEYINNQSFIFDLALLFKTIPAVLKAQGAY
jgi:exopolysaccharide biosynthesis polyprenyl glycosylphosphotransferase